MTKRGRPQDKSLQAKRALNIKQSLKALSNGDAGLSNSYSTNLTMKTEDFLRKAALEYNVSYHILYDMVKFALSVAIGANATVKVSTLAVPKFRQCAQVSTRTRKMPFVSTYCLSFNLYR